MSNKFIPVKDDINNERSAGGIGFGVKASKLDSYLGCSLYIVNKTVQISSARANSREAFLMVGTRDILGDLQDIVLIGGAGSDMVETVDVYSVGRRG